MLKVYGVPLSQPWRAVCNVEICKIIAPLVIVAMKEVLALISLATLGGLALPHEAASVQACNGSAWGVG